MICCYLIRRSISHEKHGRNRVQSRHMEGESYVMKRDDSDNDT